MEAPGIEACAGHVKIDQSSVIHEESEGDDPPQNAVENVGPPPTPPRVKICDPNRFLIAEQVFKSDASSGEADCNVRWVVNIAITDFKPNNQKTKTFLARI